MDANGTKFSLILGEADWRQCRGAIDEDTLSAPGDFGEHNGLSFDTQRFELTLLPQLFLFPTATTDLPLALSQRRGAGRDRFGNWYWIAPDKVSLAVWSEGAAVATDFWRPDLECGPKQSSGIFQPVAKPVAEVLELSALAITEDHYLVVGVSGPNGQEGFLEFDLACGGAPRHYRWPAAAKFAPFDMAPRANGGVWILDRDNHRYWELDRKLNIVKRSPGPPPTQGKPVGFAPVAPGPVRRECECVPATPITDADATALPEGVCAIEPLSGDQVLILQTSAGARFSQISLYQGGQIQGSPVSLESMNDYLPTRQQPAFTLLGHDFAFVARASSDVGLQLGRLSVAPSSGNQAFAFDVFLEAKQLKLQPVIVYSPMRSFGGKALVAGPGKAYYDFNNGWLPLVDQPRPTYPLEATLETRVFDGGLPQCVWHRLCLDACLPHEADIQVASRTADELGSPDDPLAGVPWIAERELYRRGDGSEQPFVPTPTSPDRGTFELLFQQAHGRYLQLRLSLTGNGRVTPRLRALRAYYPRFSYLKRYLPGVYREDEQSASFLDRFLANFEGFFTSIEDKIAAAQVLFDVKRAPAETLPWLASWFGVATDPAWNEYKQRVFLRHATDFFQSRGTIPGVKMALRLALEDQPSSHFFSGDEADQRCADRIRIVERFRTRCTPGLLLGDPTEAVGPRVVSSGPRWLPSDGADELNRRYRDYLLLNSLVAAVSEVFPVIEPNDPAQAGPWRDFLAARYGDIATYNSKHGASEKSFAQIALPTLAPQAGVLKVDWDDYFGGLAYTYVDGRRNVWQAFAQGTLGFIPSAASNDQQRWQEFLSDRYDDITALNSAYGTNATGFNEVPLPRDLPDDGPLRRDWTEFVLASAQLNAGTRQDLWQSFLARRYRKVHNLNNVYGTQWGSFAQVVVPTDLPTNSAALQDWFQFESVVLAMYQTAHKFVVLLPVAASDVNNVTARQAQLLLAQRLIELEKPAHTMFDVKFYWALFQVGAARLGEDTLVGLGSRAPELMTPMILNQGFLSESYLAPNPPNDTPGRFLVGTDGA